MTKALERQCLVASQLDKIPIRVVNVEAARVSLSAEETVQRSPGHVQPTFGRQSIKVSRLDHQTEVIKVSTGTLTVHQVNQRCGVNTQRWKRDLTAPPLIDTNALESEHICIEIEHACDVWGSENNVIETNDANGGTHSDDDIGLMLLPLALA
jgi:hypothetical protein